jgi:hypothetical protein
MLALQSNLPLQLFFAHEFEFSHFVMMDGWMDGWVISKKPLPTQIKPM